MKRVIAVILVLCMALSLCACSSSGSGSASGEKVIKIGVFEPSSGDSASGGKKEILGMQYANSQEPTVTLGGETYKVELVYGDNGSSTDKAPSAASSLVSAGVSVVLGSYGSGVSMAGGPKFEEAGIPAIGRMGRLSTRMTSMTAMVLTARTVYSWAALLAAFSPSRRPRYWLLMTAPPVARADRIWMIKIFRLSTSDTLETAASPTPETISVSAMPIVTLNVCSSSRGQIRVNNARLVNRGPCDFAVAVMVNSHPLLLGFYH